MNQRLFSAVFMASLAIILYLLGSSITGYISQSMHCEDGICYRFCDSNEACPQSKVCCDNGGFGVCKGTCDTEYLFTPEIEQDIRVTTNFERQPVVEEPAPQLGNIVMLLMVILGLILLIGLVYYINHSKS